MEPIAFGAPGWYWWCRGMLMMNIPVPRSTVCVHPLLSQDLAGDIVRGLPPDTTP